MMTNRMRPSSRFAAPRLRSAPTAPNMGHMAHPSEPLARTVKAGNPWAVTVQELWLSVFPIAGYRHGRLVHLERRQQRIDNLRPHVAVCSRVLQMRRGNR